MLRVGRTSSSLDNFDCHPFYFWLQWHFLIIRLYAQHLCQSQIWIPSFLLSYMDFQICQVLVSTLSSSPRPLSPIFSSWFSSSPHPLVSSFSPILSLLLPQISFLNLSFSLSSINCFSLSLWLCQLFAFKFPSLSIHLISTPSLQSDFNSLAAYLTFWSIAYAWFQSSGRQLIFWQNPIHYCQRKFCFWHLDLFWNRNKTFTKKI